MVSTELKSSKDFFCCSNSNLFTESTTILISSMRLFNWLFNSGFKLSILERTVFTFVLPECSEAFLSAIALTNLWISSLLFVSHKLLSTINFAEDMRAFFALVSSYFFMDSKALTIF